MAVFEPHDFQDRLPSSLIGLLAREPALDRAFVVGGFVRDALLGRDSKDVDVEVFGVSFEVLAKALRRHGRVDLVGKSFGVVKVTLPGSETLDFAIPRRDSKTAPGHSGFVMGFDSEMDCEEASRRRDFTLNALFYDPRKRCVIDYHSGLADLRDRRLRVVDKKTFTDDPLRVLRALQFLARFELEADVELVTLARRMSGTFQELARERVCEEWLKWASKSRRPSLGLRFLEACDWIQHFPEIAGLGDIPQDPEWHPEGDVFRHTLYCCDALAKLSEWQTAEESDRIVYLMAVLLHDTGKAATTERVQKNGLERIVSPGHESVSADLAESFLRRLGVPNLIRDRVIPLVKNHMVHFKEPTDRAIRRLAHRMAPDSIEGLCLVMKADSFGRPPKPQIVPETVQLLLDRSREMVLADGGPKPILLGRDLIALGYTPSPEFGKVLAEAFEAQLDGRFATKEAGLVWLRERIAERNRILET